MFLPGLPRTGFAPVDALIRPESFLPAFLVAVLAIKVRWRKRQEAYGREAVEQRLSPQRAQRLRATEALAAFEVRC